MKKLLLFLFTCLPLGLFPQDVQVSVFNYPGLNGAVGSTACDVENANLLAIISAVPGYTADPSIVSFANSGLLATQLAASTFFFMTDMESKNPADLTFFPEASAAVIESWVNGGGVMVMTGTAGSSDVIFLNKIFGWDLASANGAAWAKVPANTAGTPFDGVTAPTLPNLSATDAIKKNSVPNFTTMWGTDDNATVAVIQHGAGYLIFMGFDFYNTGPGCGANASDWVQQVIPAALQYASSLSNSAVSNISYTTADYTYSFSENGTCYYVLVGGGSTAPTVPQIEAGVDYGGVTVLGHGSQALTANVSHVFNLAGLSPNTNYDIHTVTKYNDGVSDVYSSISKSSFTTLPCINPTSGGTIASDQTNCFSFDPEILTSTSLPTGHTGTLEYKWQNSTTSSSTGFSDIPSSNSPTHDPPTLSVTTWYKRLARVDCKSDWAGAAESNVLVMTVYPTFTVGSISAGQAICYNTTPAQLTGVAPTGGNTPFTYQWQSSIDNTTFNNIAGATTLNYQPGALMATTYYRLNQSSASGCGTLTTNTITITVYPELVVGSISANQIICYNTMPAQLTGVAPTGGNTPYTYQWQSSPDKVTYNNIAGATTLNYQPGALTATTYYRLNQSSASGCGTLTTNTVTITVYPQLVVGSISANQSICYNTTPAQLTGVAPTGGNTPYTYQWYHSTDNANFNYIPGATTLNYQPGALTATTYYRLNQSSASGCGTLTTNTAIITVYPRMSVPTLTGPDQACQQGNPGIYSTDPGMTNYQWTASTGGVFVTGIGMSEVKVVWLTPGVHSLSVTYTTPAGCVPPAAGTKSVTVNAQPQPTIDGNNSTCLLGVKHIYTTESGMSNYVWAVPGSAGTIVSGQGTHEIEVMWFLEGDYWISVSYANPSGCSPVTATVAGILLKPIPGNAGPVTGLTNSCGPVYQVEYRVDRIPGADTYVWSVPEGAVITSGRGSWSIMVDYPTVPVSGSVSVYPMNACARGESSPPLEIRLFAVPETPVIRLEGRTLISSSESGNQWYRAEGAISGATGQTYSPVESGEYWVQVTSENCTSQPSNTLHYIGLGIDNQALSRFEIYPVPNDGQFTISFATESVQKSRVQIINSMGTTIYEWDGVSGIGGTVKDVDLKGIAKGLYFVVLSAGEQREVRKIMIL